MLQLIKKMLLKIVDDIDAGNSNLSESELVEAIESIKRFTNKKEDFSKYSAANYLNMSRATFDNYVAEGKIPHGVKKQGFKELRWYKEDLDKFKNSCKS
jgi:predicted DNA-binding transcriptional regulator AlpA